MIHPFVSNRRFLIVYYIVWLVLAIAHSLFLHHFFRASLELSIADSLLFNLIYSMIGLGLWFAVRYSQMETLDNYHLIVNHLSAVAVTFAIWLGIGYYGMLSIPVLSENYQQFFRHTLVWRILFGIMIYVFWVLIYYVQMYYNNFREKITRESELKTSVKTAELNALKSQINPHFLFNSLNSISALTISEPEKAQEMVIKLSGFLRSSISKAPDGKCTLEEELENIYRYLDIEKVRFGQRLSITKDVSKKCLDAEVPNMILQPLIENAIKHGVGESTQAVSLDIKADCFQGFLKVQLDNNFDPDGRPNKGTGIGMENIRQRMRLVYSRDDLMMVQHNGRHFRVTLNFPQNQ